ncbi:hypothetical protein EV645_6521 [Kribbella rubisoli]|uniref:Uncharacterized protein n=1 Tax=Kribbella rubisoli TaxID=3075929 RepID=A0A4Q7WPD8_9ACTN|nr:hypothetical protein EV645_6521 [Kribbella rubisoli]
MALVGGSPIEAPANVVDYVKARDGAPVRVRLGTMAAGTITVHATSKGLRTEETQSVPLLHPMLAPLRSAGVEPVLAIDVGSQGVSGYVSVRVGGHLLKPGGISRELGKHAALLGLQGLDSLSLPIAKNQLDGTILGLEFKNLSFKIGGFLSGSGSLGLHNEIVTFDATATGTVPGLVTITVPIKRGADGSLSGKVNVALSVKGFSGEVEASYANGVVDVIGTVRYMNEKFDGSVTIAATDKQNAKALSTAHTPAEVKTTAPAAEGTKPHEGAAPAPAAATPAAAGAGPAPGAAVAAKPGPRVLVGWGTVNVRLAEWLTGEASVLVDADGDVTIVGKITPKLTKPLFEQRDNKYQLAKVEVRAVYGVPVVGNVFVFANIGLEALAKLGPATLTNMEMTGTWSTKPTVLQSFGLTGTLNISAFAGLRLVAEGGAGLEILDHDIKIGVALGALAGVRGYVDATPRIGYREVADPQAGKKGEFFLGGHLDIAAQPFLQLGGGLFVDLDSPWWSPAPDKRWTWPLGQLEYPLPGEFGIGADVEHVLGSGKIPEIKFSKVDFNADRFLTDLVSDHVPPKKSTDAQKKGTWSESTSRTAAAPPQLSPGTAKPPATASKPGGPSGKTPADHAQTPKAENDAKTKQAMQVYLAEMKAAKAHPEDDTEMAATLRKLKAAGFTTAEATHEGPNWHIRATVNPTAETRVPAATTSGPLAAKYFADQPKKEPNVNKGDMITSGSAPAGQHKVFDVRQEKKDFGGSSGSVWVVVLESQTKSGRRMFDAYQHGKPNFVVVVPSLFTHRDRQPKTSQSEDRGTYISFEVGVSDYLEPKQDPAGWAELGYAKAAIWDRAHLLSGWLDGPGERWNLVSTPHQVNSAMSSRYEQRLKAAARSGGRFHFEAHVKYHATDDQQIMKKLVNPKYNPTNYPEHITVSVKALSPVPKGLEDPSGPYSFGPIDLPKAAELDGYNA